MKKICLLLALASTGNSAEWVTTVDANIYLTPVPDDCPGCAIEFVKVHQQDRWVELRTDRITVKGFE